MNAELLREHCIHKREVTESFPFDSETLVFKVAGKMFCLIGLDNPICCNLKCDPEKAIELRANFNAVIPGWHMSKANWNTIYFNQDMKDKEILEWVDHSYEMVIKGLTKKLQKELGL